MAEPTVPVPEPVSPASGTTAGGSSAPGGATSANARDDAPPTERADLIDSIADLLQLVVDWLRQEAGRLVQDKIVQPIQRLGLTLTSAVAAGCLAVIALGFIAVAVLLVLAAWLGWPGALFLVGGIMLVGAGAFTYVKMRSIQR